MNHQLPVPSTRFIGREQELAQVLQRIQDPACRLLTLIGPGGIGKTRLALEAAKRYATDLNVSAYFVNLQPVDSNTFIAPTIADALDIHLGGTEPLHHQLLHHLRAQRVLLVLDNFEQLTAPQVEQTPETGQAVSFLSELLYTAPDVKLLITSRAALNLQEEWLFFLDGMASAPGELAAGSVQGSAMDLFADRASRVRSNFSRAAEESDIIRICQLVEGMPLSIELAAAWTKVLNCAEIAAEIERNINFLVTTLHNVPERHRSMQAVFDQSWQLLTEEERTVFTRLAIFRGGFRREAAENIAGASLLTLSTFVDRSLLRWEPNGRYRVHELLRQYAYAHLGESRSATERVHNQHAHYYADLLKRSLPQIMSEEGPRVAAEIGAEFENIRQVWSWACATGNSQMLSDMGEPLQYFFDFRGRAPELLEMLEQAVARIRKLESNEASEQSLPHLLTCLGWSYIRVGQLPKARSAMEQAQALLEQHNLLPLPLLAGDPLAGLGVVANSQGDYEAARQLGLQAYERGADRDDLSNAQLGGYVQANALYNLGLYEQAQAAALDVLCMARQTNSFWFEAYVLNELGQIANALGEVERARGYLTESRRIKAHFGDAEGVAAASINLARIALSTGEPAQAEELYSQCVATYRQIGDRGGLARALHGLGDTLTALGRYPDAQRHYHDALQIAADMEFWSVALAVLTSISQLYLNTKRHAQARRLLSVIAVDPASHGGTQDRVAALLAQIKGQTDTEDLEAAGSFSPTAALPEIIEQVLTALTTDIPQVAPPADRGAPPSGRHLEQPLIEPLTERELEVLHLLAEGLTNPEIADRLIIAVGTVKSYTAHIYGKLAVRNRTAAVNRARQLKLLPNP